MKKKLRVFQLESAEAAVKPYIEHVEGIPKENLTYVSSSHNQKLSATENENVELEKLDILLEERMSEINEIGRPLGIQLLNPRKRVPVRP